MNSTYNLEGSTECMQLKVVKPCVLTQAPPSISTLLKQLKVRYNEKVNSFRDAINLDVISSKFYQQGSTKNSIILIYLTS